MGLIQLCLGQNQSMSEPSASKSLKVFVDIPKQSLCSQVLQESQHRALQFHVTGRLHLGHKNSVLSVSLVSAVASMLSWAIIDGSGSDRRSFPKIAAGFRLIRLIPR